MKKKLMMILAALACLLAFRGNAEAAEAHRGETVTLTLSVSGSYSDVSAVGVDISYDATMLELTGGSWNLAGTGTLDKTKNKAAIMFTTPVTVSGKILTLTFRVKDGADFKSCTVTGKVDIKPGGASENASFGTVTVVCQHSWGSYSVSGDSHTRSCSICQASETAVHSWDGGQVTKPASCKETGSRTLTCTACQTTKTEEIPISDQHSYGKGTKVDDSSHKQVCAVCGKETTAAHSWDAGKVLKAASCVTPGTRQVTCTSCGFSTEQSIPAGDAHQYGAWTSNGDGTHSRVCSACGNKDTASCGKTGSWFHDENGHWMICPDCGAKVEEAGHSCEVCGYAGEATVHEHSWRESWDKDESGHFHSCPGCTEKKDQEAHVYDNDCDPDCNTCGYIRLVPHSAERTTRSNAWMHWTECAGCGEVKDLAEHSFGADGKCTVCGFAEEKSHETEAVTETDSVSGTTAENTEGSGEEQGESGTKLPPVTYLLGAGCLAVGAGVGLAIGKGRKH